MITRAVTLFFARNFERYTTSVGRDLSIHWTLSKLKILTYEPFFGKPQNVAVVKKQGGTMSMTLTEGVRVPQDVSVGVLSVPWGTWRLGVYNHLNTSNREVLFPAGKESSNSHS